MTELDIKDQPDRSENMDIALSSGDSNVGLIDNSHQLGDVLVPAPVSLSSRTVGKVQKRSGAKSNLKTKSRRQTKLSCDQLRINHVTSEKKRREIVRNIYDELVDLVPGLDKNENRSEQLIYIKTINYIRWLYGKNQRLRAQISSKKNSLGSDNSEFRVPDRLIWELKR